MESWSCVQCTPVFLRDLRVVASEAPVNGTSLCFLRLRLYVCEEVAFAVYVGSVFAVSLRPRLRGRQQAKPFKTYSKTAERISAAMSSRMIGEFLIIVEEA